MTDLKALMELAAKVTPLPWDSDSSGVFCNNPDADGIGGEILEPHDPKTPPIGGIGRVGDPYPRGDNHPAENMRYIVAACNAVPSLIQRLQAAEEERDKLKLKLEEADREPKHYVANAWFVGNWVVSIEGGTLKWRRQHVFKACSMTGVVALTPPTKGEEKR